MKNYYHRNLPHWHPTGAAVFVTCRLSGSLPKHVIEALKNDQALIEREIVQASNFVESVTESKLRHYKKVFAKFDSILDKAATGSRWLGKPEVASLVQDTLLQRYADLYKLWAYVVMANHLHLLLQAKPPVSNEALSGESFVPVGTITKSIKGYTAREANRRLGRTGEQFWQQESFDHWPRDNAEFFRIIAYIENNPVKAGLVNHAEEWPWSSASERKRREWTEIRALT